MTVKMLDIVKFVTISGWVLLVVSLFGIIAVTLWMWMTGVPVPEQQAQMAGIAFGFLTGNLVTMIVKLLERPEA